MKKVISTFKTISQVLQNEGIGYLNFRVSYLLKKKTGILKKRFSTRASNISIPDFKEWKSHFEENMFSTIQNPQSLDKGEFDLKAKMENNRFFYFSSQWLDMPKDEWVTNPISGYNYELNHWTEIDEFVPDHGDIKFVWEKSRFSWIYHIIRNDLVNKDNSSEFIFDMIQSWINQNPLNLGPNYICSQEIGIRLMNWIYALRFYSDSVTEDQWNIIARSMIGQIEHVYENREFALKAVRNNHTLTEMLALMLFGRLFHFHPDSEKWYSNGKEHFEDEILYQIYEDGSYLQHSFNYQRVVVQLCTWYLSLMKTWKDEPPTNVKDRIKKCLVFLCAFTDEDSGYLPNYGANDGALFFPFSIAKYRDYRPQLNALSCALDGSIRFKQSTDDSEWYGMKPSNYLPFKSEGIHTFDKGGHYTYKDSKAVTFFKCAKYIHRPSHADNLNLDLWYKGKNIIHDSGSYLYNTSDSNLKYFFESESHNTVMLGDESQMQKGPRFMWYNWTDLKYIKIYREEGEIIFVGEIHAFKQIGVSIFHRRKVVYNLEDMFWKVEDEIKNAPEGILMRQIWHVSDKKDIEISWGDSNILSEWKELPTSNYYGIKQNTPCLILSTTSSRIKTVIRPQF